MNFMDKMKKITDVAVYKTKRHTPEILLFAGITGVVAGTVVACRATLKLEETMKPLNEKSEMVKNFIDEHGYSDDYTKEDATKDKAIITTQRVVKLATLYAPAALLGVAGVTAIVGSHRIMTKRQAVLASTLTAVTANFRDYRKRVVDRFGREVEHELKYDIKKDTVTETVLDKDGNEEYVEKEILRMDGSPDDYSVYARFFDEGCNNWESNAEYNLMFLKRTQDYMNDTLRLRGHVFLNEVYDAIGLKRSQIGQHVGWVYDEVHPMGDNYIDFGIYDMDNERKRMFVNGHEKSILLDFNVDGDISDCL